MTVWNKPPEEEPAKVPRETYAQAELLCQKIKLEDEIEAEPNSKVTKQFYDQWTKPYNK